MNIPYIATANTYVSDKNSNTTVSEYPTFFYRKDGDAGIDLHACISEPLTLQPNEVKLISTNIQVDMSAYPNMMAMVLPRSGTGHKRGIICGNGTGVIDSNYHGTIHISTWNRSDTAVTIEPMERIAQLVFVPIFVAQVNQVFTFQSETDRGSSGFGSTGT